MCSLFFTPLGIGSAFFGRDGMENSIGMFALLCSGVGWLVCGLTIWGARRLIRMANRETASSDTLP